MKTLPCTWGLAISLALHVAALCFWQPDFLHAEKVHVAGEIELLSIVAPKAEKPPAPPKQVVEKPRVISRKRLVKTKAAPVMEPVAMQKRPAPMVSPQKEPQTIAEEEAPKPDAMPPAPEVLQENVVLNQAEITRLYASLVRKKIEACKTYPRLARRKHMEGAIRVRFVLSPEGDVKNITIVRKSRFAALNTAAKKAVLSAAPFPSLPDHMAREPISLEVLLFFKLT